MARSGPRRWWLLLPALVIGGVMLRGSGGCARSSTPPDARLAGHLKAVCQIAERHLEQPEAGVRALMGYLGKHSPAMLEDLGKLLVIIERIDDDRKHDERARQAAARLRAPAVACQQTWQEFGQAVEADPAASRALQRGTERLGRTLEILFGGKAATPLTEWPAALLELAGAGPATKESGAP